MNRYTKLFTEYCVFIHEGYDQNHILQVDYLHYGLKRESFLEPDENVRDLI